ncbi:helix-turn-helix domain-containing protein [Microbacterium sp. NPDC087868]|uniref:MmyB family transcriptional regulator n=1 Tax=Microbacterium sp. NPDC087868 TaxID=3364195 RepID=UPI003850A0F8
MREQTALGSYLTARRSALQPEDVGIAREPGRRVRGLRREEVARLAAISAEYYLRLEQGRGTRPSPQVIAGLSRALMLDEDATAYLEQLVARGGVHPSTANEPAGPFALALVDEMSQLGTLLVDMNLDIVAANALARQLVPGFAVGESAAVAMITAFMSTPPTLTDTALDVLSTLRYVSDPESPRIREIIDELANAVPGVRSHWDRFDVRRPHPVEVTFTSTRLGTVRAVMHMLFIFTAPHAIITFSPHTSADLAAFRYLHALSGQSAH